MGNILLGLAIHFHSFSPQMSVRRPSLVASTNFLCVHLDFLNFGSCRSGISLVHVSLSMSNINNKAVFSLLHLRSKVGQRNIL